MGFISDLLGSSDKKIRQKCVSLYEKAKKKRPNKSERDYLKIILLTKPPFDYQHDRVIDGILDEHVKNIEELAGYITNYGKMKSLWKNRKRNLIISPNIKKRNIEYFGETKFPTKNFCNFKIFKRKQSQ